MNSSNHDIIIKGYANDVENERVNVESMCSFLKSVSCIKHLILAYPKNLFKSIFFK